MSQTKRRMFPAGWMLLVLTALAGEAGQVAAQNPGNPGREQKHFTNKPVFHLPVRIDDRHRGNLREIVLFMKTGQADWARIDALAPNGKNFTYRPPHDGEYWFTVVMIDQAGKATPPDVSQVPPGLRVIVDTQAPQLEVRSWNSPEGEVFLKCLILDANPDLNSLRLVCRSEGGAEKVIEPVPNLPGLIRFTPEMLASAVRLTAGDACGNQATMDVNVRDLLAGTFPGGLPAGLSRQPNGTPPPAAQTNGSGPNSSPQPGDKLTAVSARIDPRTPPSNNLPEVPPGVTNQQKQEFPDAPPTAPSDISQSPGNPGLVPYNEASSPSVVVPPTTAAPATPQPNSQPGAYVQGSAGADALPPIPPIPGTSGNTGSGNTGSGNTGSGNTGNPSPTNRHLLNVAHASVEYRIDQVGPSGVGKVEVYLTSDGGTSWQRFREDTDKRSPADIDLPGEGRYGIRLVVTNGNGFGGTAPQKGDAPTFWIEVDTTCPSVQLRPIEPVAVGGALDIRWTVTDKNPSAEPVSLFYRSRQDGPWQLIARNLKNSAGGSSLGTEGSYRWNFPREAGSQFFFKIEAVDQAGNVARAETPNAIVLDMTEPRASVVSVTGGSARPINPHSN